VGASAVAWGSVAEIFSEDAIHEVPSELIQRILPESAPLRACALLLPEAVRGRNEHYEPALVAFGTSTSLWDRDTWDPFGVRLLIALTVLKRWDDLREPLARCERLSKQGGRLLGAVAEAVREEMAAARGGPTPTHASLNNLGYTGMSQLLSYRPVAR
jgi:hypothetical protein